MGSPSKIQLGPKAISFLKQAQAKHSLTLEELAEESKISLSSLRRIYKGIEVSERIFNKLKNYLRVPLTRDELLAMDSSEVESEVSERIFNKLKNYLGGLLTLDKLPAMDSSEVESLEKDKPVKLQTYLEQLCREMLVRLEELTTNPLTRRGGSLKLEDIYVERGLQQLQLQPKCNLTHQEFFDQVLELGQSPTSKGRLAITGEAGAGKTTLLQKIASKILENKLGFPIWIHLAKLGALPLGQ